jgi:hypothetical protein
MTTASTRPNWHNDVFFGIHFDQHASDTDTILGRDLTHEHLLERLSRVRPDWIQCDCKGHAGYTSWPTKVGSTSPGVVKDALRIIRDVTKQLGIPLGMHYSGVWDSRAIELHPDWAVIDAAGKPSPNNTCRLSDYRRELMIPQMLEIIDKYDVDGFWVDGENWASQPCWCDRCKDEFTRRTKLTAVPTAADQPHWNEWLAFHRDLFTEHVTEYADAVHAHKPSCLICSNWMYTVRQPDAVAAPIDYLSGDYDWNWGCDRAAVEGRVLDARGITWDLMAWGFTKHGDMSNGLPWVEKTAIHLCQEASEVLALGGAIMIYTLPQRSGYITDWHMDTLAEAAHFCRQRQAVSFKSTTASQVAILHPADAFYAANDPLYNYGAAARAIEGALHAMLETHHSTDILLQHDMASRIDNYKLIVVPERSPLSDDVVRQLNAYIARGGHVIVTGETLADEHPDFVGATVASRTDKYIYLPTTHRAIGVGGPATFVTPHAGTDTLFCALDEQEPTHNATSNVVATRRRIGSGTLTAIHAPLFRSYFQGHFPALRGLIADLVQQLHIAWHVQLDAPARLELIQRRKDNALMLHLINRSCGRTTNELRNMIDDIPSVDGVGITVRQATRPTSVTLEPISEPLPWTFTDGTLSIRVPRVSIHDIVVIR